MSVRSASGLRGQRPRRDPGHPAGHGGPGHERGAGRRARRYRRARPARAANTRRCRSWSVSRCASTVREGPAAIDIRAYAGASGTRRSGRCRSSSRTRGCRPLSQPVGWPNVASEESVNGRSSIRRPRWRSCRAGWTRSGGRRMIDELDLAFDEHAERGRPRHRRGGTPGGGKKGGGQVRRRLPDGVRPAGACSAAGSTSATSKVKGLLHRGRLRRPGHRPRCTVEIKKDATLTDIGNTLVEPDVVKSTKAFVEAADDNPRARTSSPARTSCRSRWPPRTRVAALLDPKSTDRQRDHHPRGHDRPGRSYDAARQGHQHPGRGLQGGGEGPGGARRPGVLVQPHATARRCAKSIEGFLFPDTYEFDAEADRRADPEHDGQALPDGRPARWTSSTTVQTERGDLAVRGADRGLAGAGRGGQRRRTSARSPGWPTTGLYSRQLPRATACSSTSGSTTTTSSPARPTKSSKQMTQAELTDPKNPYRTARQAGSHADADQQPGRGRARRRDEPPEGHRGSTSWRSTSRATPRSPPRCRAAEQEHRAPSLRTQAGSALTAADRTAREAPRCCLRQAHRALAVPGHPLRRLRRGRADRLGLHGVRVRRGRSSPALVRRPRPGVGRPVA